MGELWRYFKNILHWGPIQKPGPVQALAHGTAQGMEQAREDALYLRDQWLPALCDESMVPEHGLSRGIIRHVTETAAQYRSRVVHAYAWHMLGGKTEGLPEILRFYGFDVESVENMRQFSPTRWAEFMVRLKTPDSYIDQEAQLNSLKTLVWLVYEYKAARSYFFRVYNDSYDRRPIVLGVGPKLGSGWLSHWSGVIAPEAGDDDTIVSFGMRYGFQGEHILHQAAQSGLRALYASQGVRRLNAFVLGRSRLSDKYIRRHGFVFSELISVQNAERLITSHPWEGPWEGPWEETTGWTRFGFPMQTRVLSFARSQLVLSSRANRLSSLNSRLGAVRTAVVVDNSPRLGSYRLSVHGPVRREVLLRDYQQQRAQLSVPALALPPGRCGLSAVLKLPGERLDENGWTGPWAGSWTAYEGQAGLEELRSLAARALAPEKAHSGGMSMLAVPVQPCAPADTGVCRAETIIAHGSPLRDLSWSGKWDSRRWWDYTGFFNISTIEG